MKKIILVFDGTNFSEGAFSFAQKLNELSPILLTGIFLPQTQLANLWSYADGSGRPFIPLLEEDDSELVIENMKTFEERCKAHKIKYRVHKNFYDFVLPKLQDESKYADVLLLGSESFYSNMGIDRVNDYLSDVLHDIKCPVLVVPEKVIFPESIILAYDGSYDSIFAIKQFAYLFPELNNKPTSLVFVDDQLGEELPSQAQIGELAGCYFDNLIIKKLDFDARKYFNTWIASNSSAILVSGSFGRSRISEIFKRSFVNTIIADHKVPVFIAHF